MKDIVFFLFHDVIDNNDSLAPQALRYLFFCHNCVEFVIEAQWLVLSIEVLKVTMWNNGLPEDFILKYNYYKDIAVLRGEMPIKEEFSKFHCQIYP